MLVWAGHLLRAYNFDAKSTASEKKPAHPGAIFTPRMILPDDISFGQLERSYGMRFMRLMLPSVLAYGTRNTIVANAQRGMHPSNTEDAIAVLGNTTALGDANEIITHLLASLVVDTRINVDYEGIARRIGVECKSWHDRTIAAPLA
ncbi:hypothetical protein N0V82_006455 [Gnomoniopsis sp. IMI 355080]|nr:hypothetical protein N0V82_006455 [Gnomoniopsis sp. IMI 355080]